MSARSCALVLFGAVMSGAASSNAQGFPNVTAPNGNPITTAKTLLGKALFWDEQMSSTRTVACGTCHIPAGGTSDPRSAQSTTVHPGPDLVLGTGDDSIGSPGVVGNLANGTYVATAWRLDPQVTRCTH